MTQTGERDTEQPHDRSLMTDSVAPRPVMIDLFAGAGGMSLGFEAAGFDVFAAVEYDPVHAATHRYNFPQTEVLCRDIRTVSASDVLEAAKAGALRHGRTDWDGSIDVVAGGPSCQGFSVMGQRNTDDERNDLILEFVRLVEQIRPQAFCLENVPGLLQPQYQPVLSTVLERLERAGYTIIGADAPVSALEFGVPQARRRVIILGQLDRSPLPLAPTHDDAYTVGDALAGLPDLEYYPNATTQSRLRLTDDDRKRWLQTSNAYLAELSINAGRPAPYGHTRAVDDTYLSGLRSVRHSPTTTARFEATPQGAKEPVSRLYRLSATKPSLTLRAGTGRERGAFTAPRPIHPWRPRVITVREAARLHSFPDWFEFHETNWHAHRQIGNAVPPLLSRAAARSLLSSIGVLVGPSRLRQPQVQSRNLLSLSVTTAAAEMEARLADLPPPRARRSGHNPSLGVTKSDDGSLGQNSQ